MFFLDTTAPTKLIRAKLSGAPATTNPYFEVAYADKVSSVLTEKPDVGQLNGTTYVTLVAAPSSGTRIVKTVNVYNADTAAVTVTFEMYNGTTGYVIAQQLLQPTENFELCSGIVSGIAPQSANTFYAGPASGAAALPTWRALTSADLASGLTRSDRDENVPYSTIGNHDDTNLTIANTPAGDGQVEVKVNGISTRLGNGVRTKDCYFANLPPFVRIVGNFEDSHALKSMRVWSWGLNSAGQLGDNTTTIRSSPVSVVGNHSFYILSAGDGAHVVTVKTDGTCWAWGSNTGGEIGDNSTTNRSSPVSVVGAHSFIFVSSGLSISSALKADGSVWGWGVGTFGAVGDNTTTSRSSPVSVVGTHCFLSISTTNDTAHALKSDGSAWGWGRNSNAGQIGDNTATNRSSPVSVVGTHSFSKISSGGAHTLALKSDGTCWAWGLGTSGRIGDNTVADRSSPVSVVGAHSFVFIAGGDAHSMALKADGSCWTWGTAATGRLGDNQTAANRSSPISVVGNHSFIAIAASLHAIALKADGSIWAWGFNDSGQIGDNTATSRSSPVSIAGHPANTCRLIADIAVGDTLIWNGTISGYNLSSSMSIDFNYI